MSTDAERDDFGALPAELPVLPIRDLVVFPFMVVPLYVSRPGSAAAIEQAMANDRRVFLVAQRNAGVEEPNAADIYAVGTLGKVLRAKKQEDGQLKVLVQGLRRARIDLVTRERPAMLVRAEAMDDKPESRDPAEVEGLIRAVKDSMKRLSETGRGVPEDILTVLLGLGEPGALADLVASNLGLKVPDAQQVLESVSALDRLRRVAETLGREMQAWSWQQKIQSQAKEEMSRAQREYFLREQLKQIRHELGDLDSKAEEIEELRARLDAARLPPEAAREADKQLRRLESMNAESAESGVVRTYLDWLADLPWAKLSTDRIDLGAAKAILDEDHFGLGQVKDRILEYLGVLKLKGDHKGPILCFVGPPGVGKTSLGRSIAKAVGREFVRISLGGVHDESEIRGHRRTYVGAMPGRIISGLKQAGTKNPIVMLDEIDKLGKDVRGDPSAALLEVLDPEQNNSFRDHYLNLPFDLSRVMWLATANLVDPIPPALRDRMEILQLPGYDIDEKVEISKRFLIPKQLAECGIEPAQLTITPPAIEAVIDAYTREAGLRSLERQFASISRKVARRFAEGDRRPVRLKSKDLEKFLGPRRHDPDRPDEADRVGLATGLAWTEVGGTILHVEATMMVGKPGLTLTGQLGTVMKESAQAALSCARSRTRIFGISDERLRDHELHVHVPHGAIPKDGPSAGITMATAMISLLSDRPIRRNVAMTGEITLRGRVLAVGGLRQKLLAAARAGITDVIVPASNEPDLSEVPKALRDKLRIHPVRELEQVLELALVGFERRSKSEAPQVGLA